MSVDIERVLRRGFERTVARNGLLFAAILFVVSLLDAMFSTNVEQQFTGAGGAGPSGIAPVSDVAGTAPPISLGLSPGIAAVLSLVLAVVSVVVTIGAIRTFVSDETETLPREHFTDDVLWPALNFVVGSIVFGIVLAIGFVLLILPGLFLLVSLFFWEVFVAVENDNFVEGFRRSWELTGGRRLRLFLLGVVVVLAGVVVNLVFAVPGVVLPDVLGFLIRQIGSALVGVFFLATVAETYTQLVGEADTVSTDPIAD